MTTLACPLDLPNTEFVASDHLPRANGSEGRGSDRDTNHDTDRVTPLAPGASARLAHLSDGELLTRTRDLAGKANQILAALLDHLAEVEARGLYRQRACSSLYTYCIYELRFSEDAAARRSSAAKLVQRFPVILEAVARGEIHLTGLLLLGPHLTDANHLTLLSLAKFRTKKEVCKLIRRVAPLPLVPDRVEPLGASKPSPLNPNWSEFIESLCPPVRELSPREPRDWDPTNASNALGAELVESIDPAGRHAGQTTNALGTPLAENFDPRVRSSEDSAAPARLGTDGTPWPDAAQLYLMQFTTSEEHANLVERARALLSHASAKVSLGELHLGVAAARRVAREEAFRFAARSRSRPPGDSAGNAAPARDLRFESSSATRESSSATGCSDSVDSNGPPARDLRF